MRQTDAMTEPHRPRVKYVIGPDGSPLTIADLPAPGTKRWVIRRKAEVVAAVLAAEPDQVGALRELQSEGKIVMQGTPREFRESDHPKVKEFLERDFDNPSFAA